VNTLIDEERIKLVIYACPRCGSRRIRQGALYVGALTGYREVCRECNYHGMPVIFDTEEEYQRFITEIKSGDIDSKNSRPLTENEQDIVSYAKEDITIENDETIDKRPYILVVLLLVTFVYLLFFIPSVILPLLLIYDSSLGFIVGSFTILFICCFLFALLLVPYGYLKRKTWAYTVSGFLFILAMPIGLIFLYYLTRPHVKSFFQKES
jgi:hypothetical protein